MLSTKRIFIIVAIFAMTFLAMQFFEDVKFTPILQPLSRFPENIDDWKLVQKRVLTESVSDMLGVDADLINQWGAVSEPVAAAMAEGALHYSQAQYALAITGIAGPGGGSEEKPVGLVWFAWSCWQANDSISTITEKKIFAGDRQEVRTQAATFALQYLLSLLLNNGD